MLRNTWLASLLILLATPAMALAADVEAGFVLAPPTGAYSPQLASLADAVIGAAASLDGWAVVLLHPASPLLAEERERSVLADIQRGGSGRGDARPGRSLRS